MRPTRRQALLTVPAVAAASAAAHPDGPTPARGLTVRMADPLNLEGPFAEQTATRTPTEEFFVRSHFAVPNLDEATFVLEVTGAVETPLKLTLGELKAVAAAEKKEITLECAGNGRVFLTPATRGLQWQFGAIGNAEWTGIPLAEVLKKAKPRSAAVEVILVGADKGAIADPATPGPIHFDRSISIEKAVQPECLLAWGMNGKPLTPGHGFPLRTVIGGYYGMASVKWLTKIVVTDKPYDGFWQTFDYSQYERRDGGLATLVPVGPMQPKAQIARPAYGGSVPAGENVAIAGFGWAGEKAVGRVEVSTDGGKSWAAAALGEKPAPLRWVPWSFEWAVPKTPGPATLLCRCFDAAGKGQPEKRDPDRRTYTINHLIPVPVTIT